MDLPALDFVRVAVSLGFLLANLGTTTATPHLGDPGTASRDDEIFSGERYFWGGGGGGGGGAKVCFKSRQACLLLKYTLARKCRIVPASSPWVSQDGDADDNVDLKMTSYFTYESRDTLKSFTLFITVKAIMKLSLEHVDKFEKNENIGRRGSCSSDVGHFTLLFSRGRQRNVARIITRARSHCSPH